MGKIVEYANSRVRQFSDKLTQRGKVRTQLGLVQANSMVSQAAENLETFTGGFDPVFSSIKGFSARRKNLNSQNVRRFSAEEVGMPAFADNGESGISSVQSLQTVSAIDVTIQMLIYSFVPFIAIERPMQDSTQTISWKSMVAKNDAAGVKKGDTLLGNFKPENAGVNLGSPVKTLTATGAGETMVLDFGGQIFEGTVLIKLTSDDKTIVGKDYDGVVLFPGNTLSFTVDYTSGVVTSSASVAATTTITAQSMVDMWADSSAKDVLRSTTKMHSVQMVARETGVIIEDSVDRMMFILKALNKAEGAMTLEQYMSQMMFDLYVSYVNNLLMVGIHTRSQQLEASDELNKLTVDLSAYGSQIIADPQRKYDELASLVNAMDNTMLQNANLGITSLVVGSNISRIMASDTFRFQPSDTNRVQMNTLIGTYDSRPVLRHQYIDRFIDSADDEGFGNLFGIHRDPSGEVGFMAYGEYLPIHTTDNVHNFQNPMEFAKALVSFIGTKIIEPALCVRGRFRVTKPSSNN